MSPEVLFVLALVGLVVGLRWFKTPPPGAWVGVVFAVLLPLTTWAAEAPAPRPTTAPAVTWHLEAAASTQYLTGEGVNRVPVFGSSIDAYAKLGRLTVGGRLLASALRDGVDVSNPTTYTSLELHGLAAFDVWGPIALAGVYGVTRPSIGEVGPNCETYGAGALVGDATGDRWALLLYGKHTATAAPLTAEPVLQGPVQAGPGIRPTADWRLLGALKFRLFDRTALIADGAPFGPGRMVRAGVRVRLW